MKGTFALAISLGVVAAFAASLGAPGFHAARADVVSDVLGCEGDPCVVKFNPGGEVSSFKAAAREVKRTGRRVVIDGPCMSACAIFADVARSRVCVTPNARMGFHKGYILAQPMAGGPARFVGRFNPSHSGDITGWLQKRGGFPTRGFRVMGARDAKRIWRGC